MCFLCPCSSISPVYTLFLSLRHTHTLFAEYWSSLKEAQGQLWALKYPLYLDIGITGSKCYMHVYRKEPLLKLAVVRQKFLKEGVLVVALGYEPD